MYQRNTTLQPLGVGILPRRRWKYIRNTTGVALLPVCIISHHRPDTHRKKTEGVALLPRLAPTQKKNVDIYMNKNQGSNPTPSRSTTTTRHTNKKTTGVRLLPRFGDNCHTTLFSVVFQSITIQLDDDINV